MAENQALAEQTPQEKEMAQQTGLAIQHLEDGSRMLSLSREVAKRCNPLTAMTVHAQIDPNWSPVAKLVEVTQDEVFKVGKRGQDDIVSLTGAALDKLARAAGVEHVKTLFNHNVAQGEGGGFECMVTSRVRGPDGLWVWSTKSIVVRFREHDEKLELEAREKRAKAIREGKKVEVNGVWKNAEEGDELTDVEVRKLILADHEFIERKAESKAFNRTVRHLFGLSTMTRAQALKPFLLISWYLTPDYSDPNVQRLMELVHGSASDALYGDGPVAPAEPPVIEPGTPGELPSAALADDEPPEPEDEEEPEEVTPDEVEPPEDEGQAEPLFDEPEDWDGGDESYPQPEDFKLPSGTYQGQQMSEVVATDEGRAYMARNYPKLRNPERKAQVMAWLSWAVQDEVTTENLDQFKAE